MSWQNADNAELRFTIKEYDEQDNVKNTVYVTRSLNSLLSEDDGGMYGNESVLHDAAERLYDDHEMTDGLEIERVEVQL
jgi:hypothetical protein